MNELKQPKFELTTETKEVRGRTLFRIKALVFFDDVEAGELGGFVEKESNLSQSGSAWIFGDARVYDNAKVYGEARVYGEAEVCNNAEVYDNAKVFDNAWVSGDANVRGDARIYGDARVGRNAEIFDDKHILQIGSIGSRNDTITFFRTKNNEIYVRAGCFCGDIYEFEARVKEVHRDSIHEKTYLLAIQLAKAQLHDIII